MDIDTLRREHKNYWVERALNLYAPDKNTAEARAHWVEFLLNGGDIFEMIKTLQGWLSRKFASNAIRPNFNYKADELGGMNIQSKRLEFHAGERKKLLVRLDNASSETWATTPDKPLFAAYHLYTSDGGVYEYDGIRTPLPDSVLPGETCMFEMEVVAPEQTGNCQIIVDLVHENKCWFEEQGLRVERQQLVVGEMTLREQTRQADDIRGQLAESINGAR